MELSRSDIQRIAFFARKVTKAPTTEAVILETFETLKAISRIDRMRIVYAPAPLRWTDCVVGRKGLEVRPHDERPAPLKNAMTVFFDSEMSDSGFISIDRQRSGKARWALEIMTPEVWSALLLQSAVMRVQKSAVSETELVRETLQAREEERRHIARELHDDLGQSLASLKLMLKWAEDLVQDRPRMGKVVKELSGARADVGMMLEKIRDLSHTLYPAVLDTLGLVSAIKELAHQVSRHAAVRVTFSTRGKQRRLGKDIDVALYRCCQEAISNALRHSQASRLAINVRFAQREVRVTVDDDGRGFDPRTLYDSNSRMMSSGFWTIRQRMAALGAAFRVSTSEGQGTVVEMIVPYLLRKKNDSGKNKTTPRR